MAKLSSADRKSLPKSDFAVPSKAPGPGSYPMPDAKHAAVAKGLAAMHGGPVNAVKKKAAAKGFKNGGMVRAGGYTKGGPMGGMSVGAKKPPGAAILG